MWQLLPRKKPWLRIERYLRRIKGSPEEELRYCFVPGMYACVLRFTSTKCHVKTKIACLSVLPALTSTVQGNLTCAGLNWELISVAFTTCLLDKSTCFKMTTRPLPWDKSVRNFPSLFCSVTALLPHGQNKHLHPPLSPPTPT